MDDTLMTIQDLFEVNQQDFAHSGKDSANGKHV